MKEVAEMFKLLSVGTRIEIIELLKAGPMTVNALADSLGVSQSAVSQHLRVLRGAGLVEGQRKGYWIYYTLDRDALERCRQKFNCVCRCEC